jgi:4-hydroxy-tetrahydrodipicolinate reductase
VVLKIGRDNQNAFSEAHLRMADVAIEFSSPAAALKNVQTCLDAGIPVVCGTTGWNQYIVQAKEHCMATDGSFLYASNFSIGVNLFFELNRQLAALMNDWPDYDVSISETHHTGKKDAPSGTAITLAEQVLENIKSKKHWHSTWQNTEQTNPEILPVHSFRKEDVPGTHSVRYASEIDDIEIIHTAHSRKGFALSAVLAAEFIKNRKGVFTMRDVLGKM